MSIAGKGSAFKEQLGSQDAPEEPGVYALSQYNIVTFIGAATESLRATLLAHAKSSDCTSSATWVKVEVTPAERAEARAEELLAEFRAANGTLPRCNDLSSWQPAGPSGEGA
ncbi:MAG TPA: hypothetical protein VNF07_02745 [Acidimicrobiales bacterium]|nr:hypothetical protein [Acidimicrobiales bacterium]